MTAPGQAEAEFYLAHQQLVRQAANQTQAAWAELDPADPVGSWTEQVRPQTVAAVEQAQVETASLAPVYVAAVLLAAGLLAAPVAAVVVARAFAGYAANGLPLAALFDLAFGHYRRALAVGVPASEARTMGLSRLLKYATTEISDTSRLAVTAASVADPRIVGYERTVHLPACGRCILLAGRLYRYTTGFDRHPQCDCGMRPVTRTQWESHRDNNPRALFAAMTRAQQNKAFGADDAAAIRAGADISRVVNARRPGALYVAGGHEYTRDSTTVRGAGRQMGQLARPPGDRYRSTRTARPTAAQLVNTARDETELAELLRRFGYLR
ncbi:hypothetical protein JOF56_000867 [Kibdelosporangium banguiense]|uniref:Uncharacterized protein n=1 Tax=Kibdelosporangium banguiense TaxID=1365924 RepID=A0ABS4T7U9_9PSEU|nr:hypothetical protein [Kibdelosporangium banguiense]MBP2320482.1 hypothetical protein [Kibdelosporangium banguiense]